MTRALILAAGQGTRLQPLTYNKPKCLVQLLGKSLLHRQTHTLNHIGINDIHVATGYRTEQIESLGYKTTVNTRYAETNMVETLFSAQEFIQQQGDLIIAYGDIVYQANNLADLLACDDEIALMIDIKWRDLWSLRMDNPLDDAETLKMDGNGYVTELGQQPSSYKQIEGQYTGLIKVRSDMLEQFINFYNHLDRAAVYDGKPFDNMYMTSFLQQLIDHDWQVKAVQVENGWLEVDTVEDLKQYEKMAKAGELDRYYRVEC